MQEQHQVTQQDNSSFSEAQMKHYFYKVPPFYIRLLWIGLAILVLGIILAVIFSSQTPSYYNSYTGTYSGGSSGINPFALLLMISGGVCLVWGGIPAIAYEDKPTDQQYSQWYWERLTPLYNKALQRLHLHESQCENIIEVRGGISSLLQLTKKFPEKEIAVKRLPSGLRHYSINVCTYIFLTRDGIAIYSGYINAFAQNERFEDADHYYYKDIVGVSTSGPIYTSKNGSSEKETQRQGFFVRASNGDVVGTDYATKVILGDAANRAQAQGVDEVVATLLLLLRDHNVTAIEANRISGDIH